MNRNEHDERVLAEIARCNVRFPGNKLVVYDARSWTAAHANRFKGGGLENTKYYTSCEVQFCDIDNIHAVREAMAEMYRLGSTPGVLRNAQRWIAAVEATGWFQLAANILQAVNGILEKMTVNNCNVLVHCTDGWDRTAQLSALTEILLDGRYRTIRGFQALIEKDWLSFGHMFARRMGHHNKDYKDDQRSPVFIQFLDLVRMLHVQLPAMFEFNTHMLTFIAYEVYTCKYGTFLCNSQRERIKYNLKEKTVAMWTYINHYANEYFRNPFYIAPPPGEPYPRITKIPTTNYFELTVWKDLFLRYCPESPRLHRSIDRPVPSAATENYAYDPLNQFTHSMTYNEDRREQLMRDQ